MNDIAAIEELMAATPVRYFLLSSDNDGIPTHLLKVHGPDIESWKPSTKTWLPANWAFDYIYTGEPGAYPIPDERLKVAKLLPSLVELTDADVAKLNHG
jgi:hypothetical protein